MRWIVCLLAILSGCHSVSLFERLTDGDPSGPPGCQRAGHVVVGLLVEGGFPNQSLAKLWTMLPKKAGELGPEHTFNPHALLLPTTFLTTVL